MLGAPEQPPTEVGGFARVAEDWKSTRFAPRAGNHSSDTWFVHRRLQRNSKAEADRLRPVVLTF